MPSDRLTRRFKQPFQLSAAPRERRNNIANGVFQVLLFVPSQVVVANIVRAVVEYTRHQKTADFRLIGRSTGSGNNRWLPRFNRALEERRWQRPSKG
jgi:hypothetical protein